MSRASRIVWLIVVVWTGFVVGNGSAQDVTRPTQVPTLTGLSVADAKAAAVKAGFVPKFELGESPQSPDQALMTYAQSPAAGAEAARGEVVTLTIYAKAASSAPPAEGTIGLQTGGRQPKGQVTVPARIGQSSAEVPASVTVVSGVPADHLISESGSLLANDLSHGEGLSWMTVRRTWLGRDTVNTHFGVGWSDPNLVRLTLLSTDRLLIWRGGTGWRTAQRDGDQFATGDGDTLRTTPEGWQMRFVSGEEWSFNPDGTLATIQSALGAVRKYAYEGGRLTVIADGPDNRLHYHYDAKHHRVSHIDGPEGLSLQYVYDTQGRLSRVTTARAIAIDYQYDGNGQLVVARDQFGTQFLRAPRADDSATPSATPASVAAPAAGLKVPAASPPPPSLLLLSRPRFKFDPRGLVTEQEDDGWTTHYSYDEAGRVSAAAGPQGRISFTYDRFGRTTGVTLPDGRTSSTQYNSLGLPVLIVLPDGTRQTLTYNRQGMLTRAEDSSGDWEETEYDPQGRVSVVRSAPGLEERYVYDDRDRVARIEYSTGQSVSHQYDASGNLVTESWSTGEQNSWVYDAAGRVVESTDAAGLKTTHVYDAAGHLLETRDAVHGKTVFQHAATGLQYSMEREGLGTTSFETTPWGLPLITRGPGNRVTTVQYNARSKPLVVSTPSQLAWRYEYDLADRMTGILAPGGQRTILSHDIGGRVAAVTRCGVAWRQYRYDALGRLERETSSAGVVETCKYDAAGRIVEVRRPEGVIRLTRDPTGTKTSVQGPGYEVEESVHPDGSLARRVYRPADLDLKLPQDKAGRAAGVELNGVKVSYVYGAKGQLERIELPGGHDIAVVTDAAQRPTQFSYGPALSMDVTYDRADRIVQIVASGLAKEPVFAERSAYDEAGNLSRLESGESPPRVMEYDADDRLRKVTREPPGPGEQSFDYDVGGNLWTTGAEGKRSRWELDEGGRPTAREALQYTWSASGNLTKTEGHNSRIENTFDAADRLVRRRVGPLEWSYGYLPEGDRLWQQSGTGKTWYAYMPTGLVGIKDEAGVTWLLVTLPDTDWPLALCGSNGEMYFAVADRLGSLRRLVDPQGKLVASADYGPFGNREAAQGLRKLSLYAGMVRDDSGLYYARQRYYDPHLARFISIDPLLGSHDLPATHDAYAYAANNPYRFRDPSGAALTEEAQQALANQLAARNLAITERINAFRARQALLGSATKVHSGLGRLAEAGASVAKEETLELIAKRLAHAERTLQNPASSAGAREYANTTLKKLSEQVENLGSQMKANQQADFARQLGSKATDAPLRKAGASLTGNVGTKAADKATGIVKVAGEATEQVAGGAVKRGLSAAGEEVAEGAVRRWGGRALRGVIKVAAPIGVALDLWGSYEAIQEGKSMNGALAQAESSDRKAQVAQKALEEMLGRLAALHPIVKEHA